MNSNNHVFLLKNTDPGTSPSNDPYVSALSSHGITSSTIPTLSHSYTEPDKLAETVGRGSGESYGGVIITSARAVDAWENALGMLQGRYLNGENGWNDVPFYVVGPRTKSQLLGLWRQTPTELSNLLPAPDLILGANEAGTGEALGRFISTDYLTRKSSNLPLLYLVGDKNAGGVEGVLRETEISLHTTQVYTTSPSVSFERDFEAAVKEVGSVVEKDQSVCVVFFAPSSAELALPIIRKHFTVRPSPDVLLDQPDSPPIKVVAIGPTTARALAEKHHINVDAVSKKPEPNALAETIVSLSSSI